VRDAAVEAFLVLAYTGQMSRQEVSHYYQSLMRGRLEREDSHVWNVLACAVADLPAPELLEDLRQAYEEGLVDPGFARFEGIERDARRDPVQRHDRLAGQYALIEDAVSEMEWWAAFHREEPPRQQTKKQPLPKPPPASPVSSPDSSDHDSKRAGSRPRPLTVHQPKVGRNDPCPCGSGKKYKKCCLGKA